MSDFAQFIPDYNLLLELEPEELGGYVLEFLNSQPKQSYLDVLSKNRFGSEHTVAGYPAEMKLEIRKALMEAWAWLEREGLIAELPGNHPNQYFVTKRGKKLIGHSEVEKFRKINVLPRKILHPAIAAKAYPSYLREDFDSAVFLAFREVEISVRKVGDFEKSDLGVDLMRRAFHVETGSLTDTSLLKAERQAVSDLFAGAIGLYKNPGSHRETLTSREEAIELLILASHLLGLVDKRKQNFDSDSSNSGLE